MLFRSLVSKGTFRFGRDRFFEWNTREPMPSVFYATPTNYSLTVNGKTTARPLEVNVSSVEQLFSIREMKGFVVRQAKLGRTNRMKGICTAKKTTCR